MYQPVEPPVVRIANENDPGFASREWGHWPWLCIVERDAEGYERGMAFSTKEKAQAYADLPYAARRLDMQYARLRAGKND